MMPVAPQSRPQIIAVYNPIASGHNRFLSLRKIAVPPSNRVLMITLPPFIGGVITMASAAARALASEGFEVAAAHRVAWSDRPELSVPLWQTPFRRPRLEPWGEDRVGIERFGVGTWLPELEWAHHLAWEPWRSLIAKYPRHIVVTGNTLPGTALAQLGLPALAWVATDFLGDRVDRFRQKPFARRAFDRVFNRPFCRIAERFILKRTDVLALSDYTARALKEVTPEANVRAVLRMPIETVANVSRTRFVGSAPIIGFAGRLSDPRKNVPLLFDAFRRAATMLPGLRLRVVGDLTPELAARMGASDLLDRIEFLPPQLPDGMEKFYAGIDGFVISSHQEGLAIVGLEAMAQALPVVSTSCGGPEEYVINGETGYLVDFDPTAMAAAIVEMLGADYARLSANALALIRERYGWQIFRDDLLNRFHALYARG